MAKSNVRRLKPPPKPHLDEREIQRIAEKLATDLEHDSESIALMTMLFDHLENISPSNPALWSAIYTIKTHLFIGTNASSKAQDQFLAEAYKNRGKLLLWPNERDAQ